MNAPRRRGFVFESFYYLRVFRACAIEHFERHPPATDPQLLGEINLAHPTFSQKSKKVVVPRDLLAQREAGYIIVCLHDSFIPSIQVNPGHDERKQPDYIITDQTDNSFPAFI
jgi:hypothetical protein